MVELGRVSRSSFYRFHADPEPGGLAPGVSLSNAFTSAFKELDPIRNSGQQLCPLLFSVNGGNL